MWKRNRNQWARLLLDQLNTGVLEAPFDVLPPEGGLPPVQSWMLTRQGLAATGIGRPSRDSSQGGDQADDTSPARTQTFLCFAWVTLQAGSAEGSQSFPRS